MTTQKLGALPGNVYRKRWLIFAVDAEVSRTGLREGLSVTDRRSTRETPREFGFRLALSGFSVEATMSLRFASGSGSHRCRRRWPVSSEHRFYPVSGGRCRSVGLPKAPSGRRSVLRRFGVVRRNLGGPDDHWHPAPKSALPTGGSDRSRSSRRPVRSAVPEVSLRYAGRPEGPSSGSLSGLKPFEWMGTYDHRVWFVN